MSNAPKIMRLWILATLLLSPLRPVLAQESVDTRNTFKLFRWQIRQPQWEWNAAESRWDPARDRWSLAVSRWKLLRSNKQRNRIQLSLQQRYQDPVRGSTIDYLESRSYDLTGGATAYLDKNILLLWPDALAFLKPSASRNMQIYHNIRFSIAVLKEVYDVFGILIGALDVALEVTNLVGTTMMMSNPPIYLSELTPLGSYGAGSYQLLDGPYLEWGEVLTTGANDWWNLGNIHRARWERWQMQTERYQGTYWSAEISNTPASGFIERFMMHWFPVEIYDPLTTRYTNVTHVRETYRVVRRGGFWSDSIPLGQEGRSQPTDSITFQYLSRNETELERRSPKRNWCDALLCYDDDDVPLFFPPGDDECEPFLIAACLVPLFFPPGHDIEGDESGDDDDGGNGGTSDGPSKNAGVSSNELKKFSRLFEPNESLPRMGVSMPVELRTPEKRSLASLLGTRAEEDRSDTTESQYDTTSINEHGGFLVIPFWAVALCAHHTTPLKDSSWEACSRNH